ncbi:ATP-grasp domain-containing protein [Tamlana sp. 2_MG-2023]|uniref:ATP-grasp domain-containing protein n=1 Tax=unclassified Tamlana TaxID=2614803 RepID=UPI0026E356AF|nr:MULTISPECIES: ATP-grasp domain-containing protein [unclassified Tamlana]MDO6760209.1 ATP-grasp domain-containing protein [Tamlana sp. 2_MG-2023]MDO6790093.1 ATP-grasp domain-containing protein [Tamlana sp. 1_MG-2023]
MKICFVLSAIEAEPVGTSVVLMRKAHERGHDLYIMGVGDFIFKQNTPMQLRCLLVNKKLTYKTVDDFWNQVQDQGGQKTVITSEDLDVLFLRNNPTEEAGHRQWAEHSGIAFARMLQQEGVLVLNDAFAMSHAYIDKLYFEELPSEIKPDSLITRNMDDLLEFWEKVGKRMVLKPLEGSGGQNIYLIGKDKKNLNQIFESLTSRGYVIAQEFLPGVSKGDVRVIVMNGKVLEENGEKAVIRRLNSDKDEFRSNLALGAKPKKTKYTKAIQHIVEVTAPKLIKDGLFFVGLDIVEDKLIEINVLSPGGLDYCERIGLPCFANSVIEAIERKIEYKKLYKNKLPNKVLATMD